MSIKNLGEKSAYIYSKPFEVLFAAVQATNRSKALNMVQLPAKIGSNKTKTGLKDPAFAGLLRIVDKVRTILERQNEYIYVPDLPAQGQI